ncbi:tRNA-dihydrouridine synthase [Nocardioides speluncae]|uniref:tRNA-dihydrouridine synthase n=1 Tax=Nocardioides speluncae TaxID=2670337 RepID=UPI000D696DAA|nr:tRNA-dihydrouridine synthase [Nocardioides speluncae]
MTTRIGETELAGPVLVAAGCGGSGPELAPFADLSTLGGFVTRSITLDPRPGGPTPRLVESPAGLIAATGLPNPGADQFLATELPWLLQRRVRVFASIAGTTFAEYAQLARRLTESPGLTGIEVNLSAPDAAALGLVDTQDPFQAAGLVAACRRELPRGLLLLVKLRPDPGHVVEAARTAADAGADAVVLGNAVPAAMPDGRPAGLGGPAIGPIALRCVADVHAALPDLPLIGCGGISTPDDARAFLAAGATAVQVGTALLHDPTTAARIAANLGGC